MIKNLRSIITRVVFLIFTILCNLCNLAILCNVILSLKFYSTPPLFPHIISGFFYLFFNVRLQCTFILPFLYDVFFKTENLTISLNNILISVKVELFFSLFCRWSALGPRDIKNARPCMPYVFNDIIFHSISRKTFAIINLLWFRINSPPF